MAARAVAHDKRVANDAALKELVEGLKANLGYAMSMLRGDRTLLGQLGWAWPRARRALEPPGQAYKLRIVEEGAAWIALAWEAPASGGPVAGYQVQRRQQRKVRVGDAEWGRDRRVVMKHPFSAPC